MSPGLDAASMPIAAALVSVGGSPAPVLHVLHQHRPAQVWYFCSAGSRANADAIQAQLDWHPQARFIEVERFEELGPCYRELRRKLLEMLAESRVSPRDVLVDYTGADFLGFELSAEANPILPLDPRWLTPLALP